MPATRTSPNSESHPNQVVSASNLLITVLIPLFNDWETADVLAGQLDEVLRTCSKQAEILFVNDSSTQPRPDSFPSASFSHIHSVRVLELRKNLGHQRALAAGLVYLRQENPNGAILVMDADGEDGPADVPLLLKEFLQQRGEKAVFAARGRRAEGLIFKFFYQLYRAIHRLLVGFDIRIGNFSVLPAQWLPQLVVSSDLWNHYAAAIVKMKLSAAEVPVNRSKRISGESKMGFVGLVTHGLSAMSVFGDVVGVRLLIASGVLGVFTLGLIFAALILKFATHLAIPGWATYSTGLLLVLLCQILMLSLIFTFAVLYSRSSSAFVPLRDCPVYFGDALVLYPRRVASQASHA